MTDIHSTTPPPQEKPRVEFGWLLLGPFTAEQCQAIDAAAANVQRYLREALPEFDWQVPLQERPELSRPDPDHAVLLLDIAEVERDARHWDFVLVLTGRDLVTHYKSTALAMPSRLLAAAVISAVRLLPASHRDANSLSPEAGSERLAALALHLLGRLNNLPVARRERDVMAAFSGAEALTGRSGFGASDLERLRARLNDVADLRVEEEARGGRIGPVSFYVRSLAENRRALPAAVMRMKPWAMPLRLTRLTTAAGSALLLLMVTAEVWEMAAALSVGKLLVLALVALTGTSGYLLRTQRLLAGSGGGALREQRAVRNVGTTLAVAGGMAVTYLIAFVIVLVAGKLMLADIVLSGWAQTDEVPGETAIRLRMAAFAATLAMVIGALGASFEPYSYFRHVTYVDEEL